MPNRISRRDFLGSSSLVAAACLGAGALLPPPAHARERPALGRPRAFSYAALVEHARRLAARPFSPPHRPSPGLVARIDYAAHGQLRYRPDAALYAGARGTCPATFFHLGQHVDTPVRIYTVADGQAREVIYDRGLFAMPEARPGVFPLPRWRSL